MIQRFLYGEMRRIVDPHEAELNASLAELGLGLGDDRGGLDVGRQRFFAKDRFSGLQAGERQLRSAALDFAGAWSIDRHFSEAALLLGKTCIELGEREEAERVFEELYAGLSPDMREAAALWIAETYRQEKYLDDVKADYWARRAPAVFRERHLGTRAFKGRHYRDARKHGLAPHTRDPAMGLRDPDPVVRYLELRDCQDPAALPEALRAALLADPNDMVRALADRRLW